MSAAEHIAAARSDLARGADYYRSAADHIIAAFDEGASYETIGRELGYSDRWVRELVQWRRTGLESPNPEHPPTPWGGQYRERVDNAARQAVRERPDVIIDELRKATPETRQRIAAALPPAAVVEALKDPETRTRVLADPGGIAVTLAMGRQLAASEPRERVEPLPSPPIFAGAFWRAVQAVQAAADELERVGVQGVAADPETRLAAERLKQQAVTVGDAVAEFVINHIPTER